MNHKSLYQYCAVGLGLCGVIFLSASPVHAQGASPVSASMMGSEIAPPPPAPPPIAPAPNITPLPVVEPTQVQPPPEVQPTEVQPPPVVQPTEVQPPPVIQPTEVQPPPVIQPTGVQPPPVIQPTGVQPPPVIQPTGVQPPPVIQSDVQPPPITTETPNVPLTSGSSDTNTSTGGQGQQGVISTTGDIGGFGSGTGSQTIFAGTGDAQAAVNEAGSNVLGQLSTGNITGLAGASVSFEAQQLVAAVLTTGEVNSVNALSTALSSTPGAPSVEATRRLASKLARLLADGQVNAQDLLDSIRSYNEMIRQSNSEFLRNPPAELLAIQVALSRLIEAAGVN
ncbi:hypothetical protein [Laspinema olomoucense]|uniref:hypothetical protein n=1 Tax=Laspinema olomoucense TaxID=3231600 RepID=UPI0021BB5B67|nr:hypothetical protein [Laspinema sp. D3a]MCT7987960.1 hypothetical protein [Laspinema sp. D3a]